MKSWFLVCFETHKNYDTWMAKLHSRSTAILIKIFLSATSKILLKKDVDHKLEEAIPVGTRRVNKVRHFIVRKVPMSQQHHTLSCVFMSPRSSMNRNLDKHTTDKNLANFFPVHIHFIIQKFRIKTQERKWNCAATKNLAVDFISRNKENGNFDMFYTYEKTTSLDQPKHSIRTYPPEMIWQSWDTFWARGRSSIVCYRHTDRNRERERERQNKMVVKFVVILKNSNVLKWIQRSDFAGTLSGESNRDMAHFLRKMQDFLVSIIYLF